MSGDPYRYLAVAEELRQRIVAGRYGTDGPLPPGRELEVELGASQRVVVDALEVLRIQGWTTSAKRAGTRVRVRPERQELELSAEDPEARRILALLDRRGHRVTRVDTTAVARPATLEEMRRLDIREAMPVVEIRRSYYVGDELVHETVDVRDAERVELRQVTELPES